LGLVARQHGIATTVFEGIDRNRNKVADVHISFALIVVELLDPNEAPALELAALYHERWEIEGVFDEFKTHLRANSTVLRSKTPDLVQQELWGLLQAHFAIRQLMAQAAWARGLDPDRLSFMHAVRVIKRKMPQAAAIPP
ncbi:MAG: transposase, partial [Thiomonas sp.]